ncbi:DNA polymerase III alpha subunit [hydrothermal vent metagenome]|uniref:DNA polymerase III alpha subunit n=1 Tax=hydrothermal vent metagenome TaxID=652676 RepID=A0A3B1BE88_9ZZZZ
MKFIRDIETNLINLRDYSFRGKGRPRFNIHKLHARIPTKVGFDIFDYEMLFNDEATKNLIRSGNTIGCFYIESPGMRSLLKRLDCNTFEMLVAASSVIRPGVAESGMMKEFIERHKDPSRRKYLVPEMEKHLGETYGVMIYQEDVIKVAHHIAGLTREEADLLRRGMSGKMRSHKSMKNLSDKFFSSCRGKGYSEKIALKLWEQIESFAGYAFNKSHSASFALVSYQVAYLKAHYPAEFMASVLNNQGGYYSAAVYIQESKRMGLQILLPDINQSQYEYFGTGNFIRIGLMAIKNLSRNSIDIIIKERKQNGRYVSLPDFLVRTRLAYEETALLIKCGAMDCFSETRPTLMRLLDIYLSHRKLLDESISDLFEFESYKLENEIKTDRQYSLAEVCRIEYETFGYMVTRHPLEFFSSVLKRKNIVKSIEMKNYNGHTIKMVGWFMASKRIKTKKGEIMKFLSLEDLTGTFEAVLFPKTYKIFADRTLTMGPYLLEGKVDMDNGHNLIVSKLTVLSAKNLKAVTQRDSVENKYYGEVEKVYEEEFEIVNSLGKENLRYAYAG